MSTRPNILLLFSDQQRWDTLGCYGQKLDVSPNLDQMATEGVRFENVFTCQPVCGPARSCLQTGKYATETGCFRNNIGLPWYEKTIAHYLSDLEYEVGYIGKWHLASTGSYHTFPPGSPEEKSKENHQTKPIPPERRGGYNDFWLAADLLEFTSHGYGGHLFDSEMNRVEFQGYRADYLTDVALEYLHSRNSRKPFFLFLSYVEPHHQNDHRRYEGPEGSRERFGSFVPPGDLKALEGDWPQQYPDYLGCCASIDYNLGRIRRELEVLGLDDNTVILYTSDHGSHFRTRNKKLENGNIDDYKRSCHDSSIRVPLIAYGDCFKGGKVIREMVSLMDVPPTILNCAGADKPKVMKGRPLQQLLQGKYDQWPKEIFFQISESQIGRGIRTERWKYSVHAPGKSGITDSASDVYIEEFLYDLENDPHEIENLVRSPDHVEVRRELSRKLKCKMIEANENPPRIESA